LPSRVIRGDINSSDSLSRVSLEADLTFRALVVAVDDYGRFDARPAILKATLFPLRDKVTPQDVHFWVDELTDVGCVERYLVDKRLYLQLTGWEKHVGKGKRALTSKFPAPPGSPEPTQDEGVYFVRSGDDGPIKISHSTGLTNRFAALRTSIPKLQVLGVLPDEGRAAEKRLHRQNAHLRIDREWFQAEADLLAWINQYAQPWPLIGSDGQRPPMPGSADPTEKREAGSEKREARGVAPTARPISKAKKQPEPWSLHLSRILQELLVDVPGARFPTGCEQRWAREIERLAQEVPELRALSEDDRNKRIEFAIRWALDTEKNLGQEFEVVIRSGRGLREKWPKLVAAAQRESRGATDQQSFQNFIDNGDEATSR